MTQTSIDKIQAALLKGRTVTLTRESCCTCTISSNPDGTFNCATKTASGQLFKKVNVGTWHNVADALEPLKFTKIEFNK